MVKFTFHHCTLKYFIRCRCLSCEVFVAGNNDETELVLVGDPEESQSNNFDIVKAAFQESKENFVDPHAEPFIPTKEWQIVKEGQSIPAGLHVRMNFQTHLKEAKLMDGDDGERFAHLSKKSTPEVKGI